LLNGPSLLRADSMAGMASAESMTKDYNTNILVRQVTT
jgi:hypothetical protein